MVVVFFNVDGGGKSGDDGLQFRDLKTPMPKSELWCNP